MLFYRALLIAVLAAALGPAVALGYAPGDRVQTPDGVGEVVYEGGQRTVVVLDDQRAVQGYIAADLSPEPTPTPSPTPTATATPAPTPEPSKEVALPARGAFYYPWFPETWSVNGKHVFYHPTLGYYDSGDAAVVDAHIQALDRAKVDVGIASWWGQGQHVEQTRLPTLFDRTSALLSPLKWSLYYEKEGFGNPSVVEITDDLAYLQRYAVRGSFAFKSGKPIIFVYADNADDCGMADRWKQAAPDWYVVLKVFNNYTTCASQPQAWHQYGPGAGEQVHRDSYVISPGYWRADQPAPTLARDLPAFRDRVQRMVASGKPWQLVTTFNEWGEGTAVESADEWGTDYIDALRDDGVPPAPTPTPTPTATPSSTPTATPTPSSGDPVVLAAGDIQPRSTTNPTEAILDSTSHDALIALGDNQYDSGSLADYNAFYSQTWGDAADKPKTYPAPGNHEHGSTLSANYCAYFRTGNNGSAALDPCQGDLARPYYSFNLGAWHFVSMDSGSSGGTSGDLTAAQKTFLTSDLAADNHRCEAVFWHHPRYSAGTHGSNANLADDWTVLMNAGVDLVLAGHDHNYQRWTRMGPQNTPDATRGIRQFVVGTGGASHYATSNRPAGLEAFNDTSFGVLKLTLRQDSYDWQFLPEAGRTFTDSGTEACR